MSEHTPITGELRDTLERGKCTFTNSAGFEQVNVTKDALDSMLDAIDAVHAGLERENAELRERLAILDNERGNMHIGNATVTIMPTLDWTGVARELRAIAATLGPAARHPKPHEQWTTVLLPEIAWGWDDRWPDYLSVAHDAHGEWRVYVPEDTLGSCNCSNSCTNSERTGACTADETDTMECVCDGIGRYGKRVTVHVMECSECGHTYEHVNGDYEYCPHCGRRVVEVDA